MTTPRLSMDDFDRDKRITALERQVLLVSGQLAARDTAIAQLLKEVMVIQSESAISFIGQYPQMLAEIDAGVLSAISVADQSGEARA